jgi:hypothetical protein
MKRYAICILLGLALSAISCVSERNSENSDVLSLDQLPSNSVYAYQYRCSNMVLCVNRFRKSGKTSALAALEKYSRAHPMVIEPLQDKKLMFVCRLLFVSPEGWRQLGTESEKVNKDVAKQFPFFPIAISDGIPFVLTDGYHIDGMVAENGATDIRRCTNLELINSDLPTTGYKKAAESLIQSKAFKTLYVNPLDREQAAQEILNQAN